MRFSTTFQSRTGALCMSILDLFCPVDAFRQQFEPLWKREQLAAGHHRRRATRLYPSEIMTVLILFQQSGYQNRRLQWVLHAEGPAPGYAPSSPSW